MMLHSTGSKCDGHIGSKWYKIVRLSGLFIHAVVANFESIP